MGPTHAAAEPEDGAPGPGVPVGAPQPGEGRHHHHTLTGLDRPGQRLELGGLADDPEPVPEPPALAIRGA